MNRLLKRSVMVLGAIAALCIILAFAPTFGRQVKFDQWAWYHHSDPTIRYYMSESVMDWLNEAGPSYECVLSRLGQGNGPRGQEGRHLSYQLKRNACSLEIDFDENGGFLKAGVCSNGCCQ